MLVQNYGLFWHRERIFWGRPKKRGHLMGVLAGAKRSDPVDFRTQQGVYVLYDDAFGLVYVGQAGANPGQRLMKRIGDHRSDALSDRWSRFSWFGVRKVTGTGALKSENAAAHTPLPKVLNHIEAILIAAAEPPNNRQGGRFGKEVQQYLQYRDEKNLAPDLADMIRQLYDANK